MVKEQRGRPRAGSKMLKDLRELIEALDRRVPHLERTGELEIAREAAALKRKALARIEELERQSSP